MAPWGSDYHTNINLQMNYWPAEVCNLSETVIPLSRFLEQLQGRVVSRHVRCMGHVAAPFTT